MDSGQGGDHGATVRSHRDLVVWQKAMDLVDLVYLLARSLPVEEMYGLRSQMRYFKQESAEPLMSKITELSKMLTVLRGQGAARPPEGVIELFTDHCSLGTNHG